MSILRCLESGCGSLIDTDDDPAGGEGICAFCRGDETWDEATERQTRIYRAMGRRMVDRASKPVSRRMYNT